MKRLLLIVSLVVLSAVASVLVVTFAGALGMRQEVGVPMALSEVPSRVLCIAVDDYDGLSGSVPAWRPGEAPPVAECPACPAADCARESLPLPGAIVPATKLHGVIIEASEVGFERFLPYLMTRGALWDDAAIKLATLFPDAPAGDLARAALRWWLAGGVVRNAYGQSAKIEGLLPQMERLLASYEGCGSGEKEDCCTIRGGSPSVRSWLSMLANPCQVTNESDEGEACTSLLLKARTPVGRGQCLQDGSGEKLAFGLAGEDDDDDLGDDACNPELWCGGDW